MTMPAGHVAITTDADVSRRLRKPVPGLGVVYQPSYVLPLQHVKQLE